MLFDLSGTPIAQAQREHTQITPKPGWVEHDPVEILQATDLVCREALASAGNPTIDAIGITNQRETVVFWDRETRQPACNAIVWQDTRTAELCNALEQSVGSDQFRTRTGLPLTTYFSGPKVRWALDNIPRVRDLADRERLALGTIDSWLLAHLSSGAIHATDPTNASRTLLMDLQSRAWDNDCIEALGINPSSLPSIVASAQPIAETSSESVFGAGVPIGAMIGDQQAALVGQGCFSAGQTKNTYGTGCFLLQHTGHTPVWIKNGLLTTAAYTSPGDPPSYALEGSVAIAGALVQWLRDGLGIIQSAEEIEPLAASVPDSAGVSIVPAFNGLFAPYWDAEARGIITGITRATTRAHLARAALEAVCFQTRDVVDALSADTETCLEALQVDGGMTSNDLLMQMQADLLGVPVNRPRVAETTALGAARAAAFSVGLAIEIPDASGSDWQPALNDDERDDRYARWREAVWRCRSENTP